MFFHRLLTPLDPKKRIRILVASMTNVAVDGILSGLLHRGHDWFVRVGSTRRIAENILKYTAHSAQGSRGVEDAHQQAKAEVKLALDAAKAVRDPDERKVRDLREALAELDKERGQDRKRRLMGQRVVGVTCAASSFDVLDGSTFPIVLLDEASQMIEPASLLPLARFHAQRLIAVGDPKQLPPNLKSLQEADGPSAASSSSSFSSSSSSLESCLMKAMFERLSFAGVPTILLRQQYRMHPTLMQLPNALFYEGRLLNGVAEEDRPPLLLPRSSDADGRPLPPLSFVNVPNGQQQSSAAWRGSSSDGPSCYNAAEVAAVVSLVEALLRKGVPATSIGVITLYRAQWTRLRDEVAKVVVQLDREEDERRRLRERFAVPSGSVVVDDAHLLPSADAWQTGSGPGRVSGAGVQVNTVDSFQGGEKAVIILSCVKTAISDFIDNERRINVALTRARHHLVIVGHQPTLLRSRVWKEVVTHIAMALHGCFCVNAAAMLAHIDRCRLNAIAALVTEQDEAHALASLDNAAGRRKVAGQRPGKAGKGKNKTNRSAVESDGECGQEAEDAAFGRVRPAEAQSDSEEELFASPLHSGSDRHPSPRATPLSPPHTSPPPPAIVDRVSEDECAEDLRAVQDAEEAEAESIDIADLLHAPRSATRLSEWRAEVEPPSSPPSGRDCKSDAGERERESDQHTPLSVPVRTANATPRKRRRIAELDDADEAVPDAAQVVDAFAF